jgi:hypothetical protein
MIHLGCAIEFQQPSLIAEALAAACVHDAWPKEFLLPAENYKREGRETRSRPLLEIIDCMKRDPKISAGVQDNDPFNKIADGLMKRVSGGYFAEYLSQFQVKPTPEDIRQKMSEMMHVGAFVMGAAQRPGKREAIDFVLLHNVTLAGHYPGIIAQDWLTLEEKARLLEAKARVDAVMYAGCASPALYADRIQQYMPRRPDDTWEQLLSRSIRYWDEGHAVKLIRTLYSLEQHFPEVDCDLPIAKSDFIKIAHMSMDSIEGAMEPGGSTIQKDRSEAIVKNIGLGGEMVRNNMKRWVFYGGLPHAWDFVPDL